MSNGPYERSGMSDRPMSDRPVSDHPIILHTHNTENDRKVPGETLIINSTPLYNITK